MKKKFRIQHIDRYKHFLIVVQILGINGTVMNQTCHSDTEGFLDITSTVPLIEVDFYVLTNCNLQYVNSKDLSELTYTLFLLDKKMQFFFNKIRICLFFSIKRKSMLKGGGDKKL